jgi:pimeloyl-ACP methyl ester carboxylesterase
VVLIDPALGMDPERGRERLPDYILGVGQPVAFNEARVRANNPDWAECDVVWKLDALAKGRPAQVEGLFLGGGEWSLVDRFAQVEVPLLLLVADLAYTVIPPERLGEVEAKLRPGLGRMLVIPGTTHNMLRGSGYVPTMEALTGWLRER